MNYQQIGIDSKMRKLTALSNRNTYVDPLTFDSLYDIQASHINASKFNLGELVRYVNGGSGTADFSSGSTLTFSSTITYNQPNASVPVHGFPYVALYQGTVLTTVNQIYPVRGANVTPGRYSVQWSYDLNAWDRISARAAGEILDTTGSGTQVITFDADWAYIDYQTTGIQ